MAHHIVQVETTKKAVTAKDSEIDKLRASERTRAGLMREQSPAVIKLQARARALVCAAAMSCTGGQANG